jgi:hypothetical protein
MHSSNQNLAALSFVGPGYRCSPARYSKNKMILHIEGDGSGWKTRGANLAEALGAIWARGHEQGYRISPRRATQWKALYEAGFDARRNFLSSNPKEFLFSTNDDSLVTLKDALVKANDLQTKHFASAASDSQIRDYLGITPQDSKFVKKLLKKS